MDTSEYLAAPSVSVVIPAYNRAGTIGYCLDSIFRQTVLPDEVLVVDDCSSDATVETVMKYPDPRVRCIRLQKNSGAQAARNRGIREAKGEWIAFQDSDDEWLPSKLEKQIEPLRLCDFDPLTVVHGDYVSLDPAGDNISVELPLVEGDDVYSLLLSRPGPCFPSLLVSKSALERIGYLDEMVPAYQEWDTSIRLAGICRFVHLREPLFIYHLHSGETISKDKERDIRGYQYIIDKFEPEIRKACGEDVWHFHHRRQLIACLSNGFWRQSDRYLSCIHPKDFNFRVLQLCRLLHLSPTRLSRLKTVFCGK
jgi:Glycosyltransferases involved in cell wall biogenesis